jgi:hypothetical protein
MAISGDEIREAAEKNRLLAIYIAEKYTNIASEKPDYGANCFEPEFAVRSLSIPTQQALWPKTEGHQFRLRAGQYRLIEMADAMHVQIFWRIKFDFGFLLVTPEANVSLLADET